MTGTGLSIKLAQFARRGDLRFLVAALLLSLSSALSSGPGPGGVNIGFDFNWSFSHPPEPTGATASFIASTSSSGATLNNCGGPVTASTVTCDFAFAYSVGGVAQPGAPAGGVYQTWTPPGSAGRICDTNPANSAPLTLFNCFNNNSFGQVFMASASGPLTAFSMPMTCLNPAGTPPTGLFALIYQVNAGGITIPATPLASTPLDLSTCPTLTSWDGHTFSSADFASIPMNFSNVTLTSGTFYAVYFGGLVPGSPLPGAPAVTSVTPNSGPRAGGNTVTLAGTGFTGATSVTFGGVAATSFTVVNNTTITAVVPGAAATGAVSVIVTTPNGSNNANTLYSYVIPAPTVTSVTPSTGPPAGGNTVTIAGAGFTGATSVTFGGVAATSFTVVNDTTITATVPASATRGAVSVVVTAPGGSNAANSLYTYSQAPTVTSVNPSSGPPGGGNTVTIAGTGLTGATSVTFGGVAATSFNVVNDTTITAVVPRNTTAGAVSVIVTTPGGSNAPNSLYSYVIATPTLGEWGLIALAGLLILFVWLRLRRDERTAT